MKATKPETLSVEEASQRIGTCYATALKLVKTGALPSIRLGRQFRVLKEPLEKMLRGEMPNRAA
jgi:excisionase family DNA binding protein